MKKYNLFKVIGLTVIVAWLLTLFIPGSYLDYSGKITNAGISGVGIWTLISNSSISISYFNSIVIFLVAVAAFYSILSKVDTYNKFIDKVASAFENKKGLLITLVAVMFGVLSLFVDNSLILIAFVPFIYQVMKKLEIDKKVILSSTIIAGLIGSMSKLYNTYIYSAFSLKLNTLLLVKVILFVLSLSALILFIKPKKEVKVDNKKVSKKTGSKDKKSNEKKNETKKVSAKVILGNENKVNKTIYAVLTILFGFIGINKFYAGKIRQGILSILFCWTLIPFILSVAEFIVVLTRKADKQGKININTEIISSVKFIVSLVIFVLFVIGSTIPWESLFENLKVFSDFNSLLAGIKIGDYAIFGNIIGQPVVVNATTGSNGVIPAFGSWTMSEISILLIILTPVIAFASDIKLDKTIEYINDGIKKVLPVAITAMLISIVLVVMVTTGVNITIAKWILTITKEFNVATSTITTMVCSLLTGDFYYFVSTVGPVFTAIITNKDYYGVIAFIVQSVFNLMMIIAPTSVGLIVGLYYLDISFTKWVKYIWKLFLLLLVIILVISIIIFALV